MEFTPFPKLARLSRECIITEKLDGTNAQIAIVDFDGDYTADGAVCQHEDFAMYVGSRTRWITPADDNQGFAKWCLDNAEELFTLGKGHHFGEWWGRGIQRGYGLTTRKFSLFNTERWSIERPSCCDIVPVLDRGIFTTDMVETCLQELQDRGSFASPGFMNPEGVVCFHVASQKGFKKTLDNDHLPKTVADSRRI